MVSNIITSLSMTLVLPQSFTRPANTRIICSLENPTGSKEALRKHFVSGFAAILLLSQAGQGVALDLSSRYHNICQLGSASVEGNKPTLPLDDDPEAMMMMMMRGMTAKNFDPVRYSGRWFEVASLKRGFAGQGQEDCHCTQGVYTFDMKEPAIRVDTFCVHGSPDGYITGIRGKVQCVGAQDLEKTETDLEKQEMIKEKCYLRFPTIPFIPKLPYDVIATDYDNYALVSGAKDRSFVQVYSRTPNPGPEFIAKYKDYLAQFGYDPEKIKDTPQDCEVMSDGQLAAMMSMPGMEKTLTNQFPDLELRKSVQFDPFTSVFETLKKLVPLYFK
ncbi:chloroplastic lipocalin isoform X2 [Brassica rapa]|uniref:chloroplastic lipocalin isoform X2 n=1 Tax=Brassica campestris TaxID=3711 RepID=UPI0004F19A68|nr:chloroplastic lipocalin isoform X2 [Brassica rapa]XP_013721717.2 chloroplastic lipocalin isoform X3 [Brassica napus]